MTARDDFVRCALRGGGVYRYCSPSIPGHCYDCSGYVRQCWAEATGREMSGDSHTQFNLGRAVSGALKPGDLIFFDAARGREVREGNRASHVGIYVGDGQMANALNENAGIVRGPIDTDYWRPIRLGNRRLFDEAGAPLADLGGALPEPPTPTKPSTPDTTPPARTPRRGPERERTRDRRRFWQRVSDTVRRRRVRP